MSNSYRDDLPRRQAQFNIPRDRDGLPVMPRIVVHEPRRGDIHHVDTALLTALWRRLPLRFRYGVQAIELRARQGELVGQPYAYYVFKEKSIVLFSCPPLRWPVGGEGRPPIGTYEVFGATTEIENGVCYIRWPSAEVATRFMVGSILGHELGHHYMHQYKGRRKLPEMHRADEIGASKHGRRLGAWRAFNALMYERRGEG